MEANVSLLDISAVMSSNFTGVRQIYERDPLCAHLYAWEENASHGPYSPVVARCLYSQQLMWGMWSCCPRGSLWRQTPPESRSQHPHQALNCPPEKPVYSLTAERARKLSSISSCKFCCCLLPHPVSPRSKDRGYPLSTVKRGHWKRQHSPPQSELQTQEQGQEKLISLGPFLCTKPCFRKSSPVHRSFISASAPFSRAPGMKERTYWCSFLWEKWCSTAELW